MATNQAGQKKAEESIEKSTSEQLREILAQLSVDQIRFVVARQDTTTDKEAAEMVSVRPSTVYNWPAVVKEVVQLMAVDGLIVAEHIRRRNLAKAMQVKVGGLDSGDERVQQSAATEVIEWELGKAVQRSELTGAEGKEITVKITGNVEPNKL